MVGTAKAEEGVGVSRDAGFDVADRATRTLYDPLIVKAYRKAGLAAVVAWDAIVDASWAAGHRVTFEDATLPLPYDLGTNGAVQSVLQEVGLLDGDGMIRASSWEGWFGAADERRAAARERQARFRARTKTPTNGDVTVRNSDKTVPAGRPAVRPVVRQAVRSAGAREKTFDEIGVTRPLPVAALGFHPVPKPTPRRKP